jgi:hypothetical protein
VAIDIVASAGWGIAGRAFTNDELDEGPALRQAQGDKT